MTIIFCTLLLSTLAYSLFSLIHTPLTRTKRILLASIRFIIISLCACAYFQPSFHMTRLVTHTTTIPVLFDCSESMQLFSLQSLVHYFDSISTTASSLGKNAPFRFSFYGFGDSLRPFPTTASIVFSDKHSVFPHSLNTKELRECNKMVLVSDGNWSGAISGKHSIHEKECYYIPLEQITHTRYLHVEAPSMVNSTADETIDTLVVSVSGYVREKTPVTVTCQYTPRTVSKITSMVDSGFFSKELALPLVTQKPGTYQLHINVQTSDTLSSSCQTLRHVTPARFTARLYAPRPSLDKRFLSLAFTRHQHWQIVQDSTEPDVLVFFSWDAQAQQLQRQFPASTLVFMGTLPCENTQEIIPAQLSPRSTPEAISCFSYDNLHELPPLSEYMHCSKPAFTIQRTLISYDSVSSVSTTSQPVRPLLFDAEYHNALILVFAAKGIWRWDFWPQSTAKNRDTPLFSDGLIACIEECIRYNANRQFYVYPDITPAYETDSLSFRLGLPSNVFSLPSIALTFTIHNETGDTVFTRHIASAPSFFRSHPFRTRPLLPGRYRYTCTVSAGKETVTRSDSITVFPDNSEWRVIGQNTLILDEIARPLVSDPAGTTESWLAKLSPQNHTTHETILKNYQLQRSWPLLLGVLLLFSIEWALRRIWHLD